MADDDPYLAAVEQYIHWCAVGLTNREMLVAVRQSVPAWVWLDAETTIRALTVAYRQLQPRRAA